MLDNYQKKYLKNNFQLLLVDNEGSILEVGNPFIKVGNKLQDIHPFFESVQDLLLIKNQQHSFSCVNLDFDYDNFIVDIIIHTVKKNETVVIIENLTKHYNNYQITAQRRNETVINYEVLELKNKYLLEKETFKNNFIANFSHQLRNPITASAIFSKLLLDTNLSSEQKNYLDIILSANKDLKERINDILDVAKIESGKLILSESVFNFKDLLNELITGYSIIASKKGLDFKTELAFNLPDYIRGDAYRLKQILGNILSNAFTYTTKGSVHFSASLNYIRAKKVNLHFEISDTGIGIDQSQQEEIFERFTKVNEQNNRNIGLGLSIVKHLVEHMNGNISIESQLDKGSKFICNLSFKLANEDDIKYKSSLKELRPKFDTKKNLLLIEDSELIQLSVLKILSSDGNFFLNIVSNGEDVIASVENQEVDIILISNTIQRYAAEEIAKSIRAISKETRKIPILALSSEVFRDDIKRYKSFGIKDVISKPFNDVSFLDKIYKHVK
ncbi:ATP-binding protein [Ichthyenterobacterium sp. W332]|uniref:histidine kinase n=1 Tax=Microcosmobacter mediterraneus TaxID=3075607 RepID=A0ABU2YK11_9FLAO|nr:ATP-binding protein [Ichthyenterobacterium sp. W332]MDT0558500.1 ATP-binding protein [Ichthyenterobacterium sp. W332]